MKLLFLLQGKEPKDQIGFHQAFERMVQSGQLETYHALPYLTYGQPPPEHWPRLHAAALDIIRVEDIDILFLQYFHAEMADPRPFVAKARKVNPRLLVVTSCGDGFGRWLHPLPLSLRQASSVADLTFSTSMGYMADTLVRSGARNVVLMPNGVCQERFTLNMPESRDPDFDVIFIGSGNGGRNPFTPLSRAGRKRRAMIQALERRYGTRFAVFGSGWDGHSSWQGPVPFDDQHKAMWQSRLQVGGFPGSYATYYTSNRAYIAIASGVPLLDCNVPRVDKLMEPHRHWVPYRDIPEMLQLIDKMLNRPQEDLDSMGAEARDFALGSHTHAHRVREVIDIARSVKEARVLGRTAPPPLLRCFHPRADPAQELPWAVRNWHG